MFIDCFFSTFQEIDFLQEAKSSNPDFIVYIPKGGVSKGDLDTENVHFLVLFRDFSCKTIFLMVEAYLEHILKMRMR